MATHTQSSPTLLSPRPLRQTQPHSSTTSSTTHSNLTPSLATMDLATTDEAPKEGTSSHPQEPPPAYTPPIRTRLQENIAMALLASNPTFAQRIRSLPLPAPTATLQQDAVASSPLDPDEEPLEELSPISLRVSTRINVARDNNVLALAATPAEQAGSIAQAIVAAFKSGSVAEGGIPMIDQDGRPRPVRVEVDAGITVEGANNVVGTEAAVMDIMRARHAALRQRMASVGAETVLGRRRSEPAGEEPAAKRRRE